jgi:hypothetical protein
VREDRESEKIWNIIVSEIIKRRKVRAAVFYGFE